MESVEPISWYAIRTKPCQEERAAENLEYYGIEILAPRLATKKGESRWKPFFPGYIFARFDIASKLQKVSFTRGVAHVVSFGGTPAVIQDEIIVSIRQRSDARGVIHPPSALKYGDVLVIHTGPFRSFSGMFEEEMPASERIRILLTTVAYSAHIEVSKYDVSRAAVPA